MSQEKEYFDLKIEDLISLGKWTAKCAKRSLYIYENIIKNDNRPINAINGILEFVTTGKRTNKLRKLSLDAYRASIEIEDAAASAAAQSASLAASSAFTHPFKDKNQGKHILGSAVYSALASEIYKANQEYGTKEIEWACDNANYEITKLLMNYPEQIGGEKRIEQLFYQIDQRLRKI